MSRELADITIKLSDLEDVIFDEVIEYLEDQKIKYEVLNTENRRTEYEEDDAWDEADVMYDRKMLGELWI